MQNPLSAKIRMFAKFFALSILVLSFSAFSQAPEEDTKPPVKKSGNFLRKSARTDFSQSSRSPKVSQTSYLHKSATLLGDVSIGDSVFLGPRTSVRGDEGYSISIGNFSNIQDGVVIHALEVEAAGQFLEGRTFSSSGERGTQSEQYPYAVYISSRVSLAPMVQIHGPAWIGEGSLIGSGALVFNATIGPGCIIEPGAKIIDVDIPPQSLVKAGQVITRPEIALRLPKTHEHASWKHKNASLIESYQQLTEGYNGQFDPEIPSDIIETWNQAPKTHFRMPNTPTQKNLRVDMPSIDSSSLSDDRAILIGDVHLNHASTVYPSAILRADTGAPIVLEGAIIAPGASLLSGKNFQETKLVPSSQPTTEPSTIAITEENLLVSRDLATIAKNTGIFIENGATIGPQAQIYGPVHIGKNASIGARAIIAESVIEEGAIISPGAVVFQARIPANRLVAPGKTVRSPADISSLPLVPGKIAPEETPLSENSSEPTTESISTRPAALLLGANELTKDRLATLEKSALHAGNVSLGAQVYLAANAILATAPSRKITVKELSNVQNNAILYASAGDIVIEEASSISHQTTILGPATISQGVFIGMQSILQNVQVGAGCVIEPGAVLVDVKIPPGRYIPAGQVITSQADVETLPEIDEQYLWWNVNEETIFINASFAAVYATNPRPAIFRNRSIAPEEKMPSFWDNFAFLSPIYSEEGILILLLIVLLVVLGVFGAFYTQNTYSNRDK